MTQTPWQDLIPYYVARSLPPAQMQAFEAQLAHDSHLRQELEDWRRIAAAVWREADAAARHLPPLSPEIYKQLQYRNGAQPVNPTAMPLTPRVRQMALGRLNSSPLMFVAGFLVVFLCGGALLLSAIRQIRPEIITTAVAMATDGLGAPMSPFTPTPGPTQCVIPAGSTRPGCVTATPSYTPTDSTWTPIPRASSTPIIVRPLPTMTPRSGSLPTITPVRLLPTQPPANLQPTQVVDMTVCTITNSTGQSISTYAYADYSAPVISSLGQAPTIVLTRTQGWVEIGYAVWVPIKGMILQGPCDAIPLPSPTNAAYDCTVVNSGSAPLPLSQEPDVQSPIVTSLPAGESTVIVAGTVTGWYEIYYNGRSGWFPPTTNGVTFVGNCSSILEPSPTFVPTYTPTPVMTDVPLQSLYSDTMRAVPRQDTVFYTSPDRGSPTLIPVGAATYWFAVGTTSSAGTEWVSVRTGDGQSGWIEKSLVDIVDMSIPTTTPEPPSGS